MITILLEKIITILEGWLQSFTSHAQHVEDKLDSLDQTASDIETNTEPISDIKDNTGAVITPIQNIKTNTDSIATSSQTSANNTTAILNNISTLSTNTGKAAAFAEDCANNTLEIKGKITTIASDTTQIRADNANIAADVSSINQAIGYYVANTPVTEDVEGSICNIDTDLTDYLQACKVTIPADLTGFSGITLSKCGKNILNASVSVINSTTPASATTQALNIPSTIVFSMTASSDYANSDNYWLIYIQKSDNSKTYITPIAGQTKKQVIVADSNNPITAIYYRKTGITSGSVSNFMIEIGNTATSYEPYKIMTYPVSFGSTITDGAEADLLSGLVKVNTTPESYIPITPIAVRTYKGVNNIFSDIGSTALTYRETLKKYLEKHNQ